MEIADIASLSVKTVSEPLKIHTPLYPVVAYEGTYAQLQCTVKGHADPKCAWYKNGKSIEQSNRIKIISSEKSFKLVITNVKSSDRGLYMVAIRNNHDVVTTQAPLYIGSSLSDVTRQRYFTYTHHSNNVVKHLCHTKVKVGDAIKLRVEFKITGKDSFWYRNNELLTEQAHFVSNGKVSKLIIENASLNDSGLYTVVKRSKEDIATSIAYVCVVEDCVTIEEVPHMIEPLPDEVEVLETEDIALVCKVSLNEFTNIQWTKNGNPIDNERMTREDYGDQFIGLKIVRIQHSDKGDYSVVIRDKVTGIVVTSTCYLSVEKYPTEHMSPVEVIKPLECVAVPVGTSVTFHCSFRLPDPRYYFVTWLVGLCEVERSSTIFKVVCQDGDFLLHIKQLQPDMAGKLTCELRMYLPLQKSVVVGSTSSQLTIIPQAVLEQIEPPCCQLLRSHNESLKRSAIVWNVDDSIENCDRRDKVYLNGSSSNNGHDYCEEEDEMTITYCRLEDSGGNFLEVPRRLKDTPHVEVFNITPRSTHISDEDTTVRLKWLNIPKAPSWYSIDLYQQSGLHHAGVTSEPQLDIRGSPGRILKIRVRAIAPVGDTHCSVCISPPRPHGVNKAFEERNTEIRPIDDFEEIYCKAGKILGNGNFGRVELVQDHYGAEFAAKTILTPYWKNNRTMVHQEYTIMRKLNHPCVVRLIAAFANEEKYILVMEYMWGGDLLYRIADEDHFQERDAVAYVRQILEALQYLHGIRIAHLDIKSENVTCCSPNSNRIKLIDFGLARELEEGQCYRAVYGTREYMAPEVMNYDEITFAADMWSLGVVTYVMLMGQCPGEALDCAPSLFELEDVECSTRAQDFIDRLIVKCPGDRLTATEALNHAWIKEGPPPEMSGCFMRKTRGNLKTYLATHKARWQRAGNVMIAAFRMRSTAQRAGSNIELVELVGDPTVFNKE